MTDSEHVGDHPPASGWRAFAESVPGTSHARAGLASDDACCVHIEPRSECFVAAIADGAGTSSLGGLAAQIAVKAATESIQRRMPKVRSDFGRVVRQALTDAHQALFEAAVGQDKPIEQFGTTLITMVANATHAAVGQVGDGFALVVDPSYRLLGFSEPQNGEFVNETVFLNTPDAVESAVFTEWRGPIAGAALLTDGLQRLAWRGTEKRPHDPFFASLFRVGRGPWKQTRAQISGLLNSERIAEKTDDDVSLILAWRR